MVVHTRIKKAIRECIVCNSCIKPDKCIIDDMVNELSLKFEKVEGLVTDLAKMTK